MWIKLFAIAIIATGATLALALIYGTHRWEAGTAELRSMLEAARAQTHPDRVDFRELEDLPPIVQRYFTTVLKDGQSVVAAVNIEHSGTFNMGETTGQWKPFTSTQRVITHRRGFDWDGRITLFPGLSVHVHDAYVAGEGMLRATLFGLIPLADLRGTDELARGELMRFMAEAAWYPTALLPGQGVHWEAVDDSSARATLTDGVITVSMLFSFTKDGLIDTVHANARGRMMGSEMITTPWQGRFWNYATQGDMLIPIEGEVAWLLPEGPKPYWRGNITRIEYDFTQ